MSRDLDLIINAIPVGERSQALIDALAFEEATADLLRSAKAGTPIDLTTATTPANAAKVIEAAVVAELGHDARIRYTEAVARIATERVTAAKVAASNGHIEKFRAAFDAAANELYTYLAKQPVDPDAADSGGWNYDPQHAELRTILTELGRLGAIRDNYAFRFGGKIDSPPVSIPYEELSRVAVFVDNAAAMAWHAKIGGVQRHSPKFYLWAAKITGVTLRWQDRGEQNAQPFPAKIAKEQQARSAGRGSTP